MAKLFSTKTHGVLDYMSVAQLALLPRMLGWSDDVTRWMTVQAAATLGSSLVTRYELGPLKLLPMRGHLAIDFLQGTMFCAFPLLFPDESPVVKSVAVGFGLFEIFASLSTETEPSLPEQAAEFGDEIPSILNDAVDLQAHEIGA